MRAITILSRFALVFALARLLSPADVGLYGLIAGTVSFSMLFIGGEFYTYSQRELLAAPRERWSFIIQHQALAGALLYTVLIPLQLLLFAFDLLPDEWLGWFLALLVAEHLAQECNRLLVTVGRPVLASLVLFLRMGAWVWVLLAFIWRTPDARAIQPVFTAWLAGASLAVLLGGVIIAHDVRHWRTWPVDWPWIHRGFATGLLFLVSTLCFKAIFTADRYVVEELAGIELLGVYVVYMGIATAVVSFLDAAVFSFLYPRLVAAHQAGDQATYGRLKREMLHTALGVGMGLAALAGLLAPFVLRLTGKAIYLSHLPLLWLLLAGSVTQIVSMVPHYGLYARKADRTIVAAHVSASLAFVIVTGALARVAPLACVAWGLLAALAWLTAFKQVAYHRLVAAQVAS